MPSRIKGQKPEEVPLGEKMQKAAPQTAETVSGGEKILRWLHSSRISPEDRGRVLRLASSGLPVFLQGEEGTGKAEIAKAFHLLGPWKAHPLIAFSCRGLTPRKFMERLSLWTKDRSPGDEIWLALYLEGVESLEEELQGVILDLLTDQQVRWPGLERFAFVVQVLSSSSSSLAEAVTAGKFREDLFQKLETLAIYLPPLRERKEEIPRLVQEILKERAPEGENKKGFSPEALQVLQDYEWPGNLPELESVVLRSAALKEGELLGPEDLAFHPSRGSLSEETPPGEERESWFDVTIPTLAHEIKNPLVAISTFAHLLPEKYEDPEFRQEFSRLVSQDVRRINDLLENLLEFAQFSSLRPSLHDLNSALNEILQQQEKTPGPGEKEILKELGNGLPPVLFDKWQLEFTLRNLLENAFAKLNPRSPLQVTTRICREEGAGGAKDFVDLILWYNSPDGVLPNFSKVAGFGAEPDFQNLNLSLLLIRKVMVRNRGKMQILQGEDGGMTVRLQFAAEKRKEGVSRESDA